MIRLYKNGSESPPLHPIDAVSWREFGWTDSPQINITTKNDAIQTEETEAPQAVELEGRYLELSEMSWREIKRLHEDEYQLGDYPGKDEAIAAILQHEGL